MERTRKIDGAVYRMRTPRIIPLVMLKAIEPLAVFSEADLADA